MVVGHGVTSLVSCVFISLGVLLLTFAGIVVIAQHPVSTNADVVLDVKSRRLPSAIDLLLNNTLVANTTSLANTTPLAGNATPAANASAVALALGTLAANLTSAANASSVALALGPPVLTSTTVLSSFDSWDSSSSGSSSESSKSSEPRSWQSSGLQGEEFGASFAAEGTTVMTQLVLMICFACCYNSYAVQPVLEAKGTLRAMNLNDAGSDDFENGICECCSDRWVCIHGFCCPLVRMAHTNAVAGVSGFWESVLCFFLCSCMSLGIGPCCLIAYWRMQLKEIMGIADHPLNDFAVTLCCPYLSVCQQGTAVDTKLGYQVVGCCDLEWADDTDMLLNAN